MGIMPPGMDGLGTYKRIVEINPKQKVIIVSSISANKRVKERIGLAI
jgi:two-component system cell cycle sensor histidine kinase/response regulator CckA